jgi:hypothetical protein
VGISIDYRPTVSKSDSDLFYGRLFRDLVDFEKLTIYDKKSLGANCMRNNGKNLRLATKNGAEEVQVLSTAPK